MAPFPGRAWNCRTLALFLARGVVDLGVARRGGAGRLCIGCLGQRHSQNRERRAAQQQALTDASKLHDYPLFDPAGLAPIVVALLLTGRGRQRPAFVDFVGLPSAQAACAAIARVGWLTYQA